VKPHGLERVLARRRAGLG